MKSLLFVALFFLIYQSVHSQAYKVLSTNTIYAEAGGLGVLYSINYDKVINWPGKRVKLDVGIGGTYLSQPSTRYNFYTGKYEHVMNKDKVFMVRSSLLFGKPPFLGGFGIGYFHDDKIYIATRYDGTWWESDHTFLSYLNFRYQPLTGGLFYAINLNLPITSSSGAFINRLDNYYSKLANIYFWPGLCIGYTFRGKEAKKVMKNGS